MTRATSLLMLVALAAACGSAARDGLGAGTAGEDAGPVAASTILADAGTARRDAGRDAGARPPKNDGGGPANDGGAIDASAADSGGMFDAGGFDSGGPIVTGPITGGPCVSGAGGATAFRVRWINAGGKATPSYEVNGLPDASRWKVGAYGYSIGFTAAYVDPYLGPGGLGLDGSDFVDVEISTAGLSQIHSATLAIYGRSYDTTASGSFSWQTFHGTGTTVSGAVSNAAPYVWYGADITSELPAGDSTARLRIKAGGPSGALVVNRIELCLDAD